MKRHTPPCSDTSAMVQIARDKTFSRDELETMSRQDLISLVLMVQMLQKGSAASTSASDASNGRASRMGEHSPASVVALLGDDMATSDEHGATTEVTSVRASISNLNAKWFGDHLIDKSHRAERQAGIVSRDVGAPAAAESQRPVVTATRARSAEHVGLGMRRVVQGGAVPVLLPLRQPMPIGMGYPQMSSAPCATGSPQAASTFTWPQSRPADAVMGSVTSLASLGVQSPRGHSAPPTARHWPFNTDGTAGVGQSLSTSSSGGGRILAANPADLRTYLTRLTQTCHSQHPVVHGAASVPYPARGITMTPVAGAPMACTAQPYPSQPGLPHPVQVVACANPTILRQVVRDTSPVSVRVRSLSPSEETSDLKTSAAKVEAKSPATASASEQWASSWSGEFFDEGSSGGDIVDFSATSFGKATSEQCGNGSVTAVHRKGNSSWDGSGVFARDSIRIKFNSGIQLTGKLITVSADSIKIKWSNGLWWTKLEQSANASSPTRKPTYKPSSKAAAGGIQRDRSTSPRRRHEKQESKGGTPTSASSPVSSRTSAARRAPSSERLGLDGWRHQVKTPPPSARFTLQSPKQPVVSYINGESAAAIVNSVFSVGDAQPPPKPVAKGVSFSTKQVLVNPYPQPAPQLRLNLRS